MVQRRSTPEEKTKNKNKNIYIRQNKTIRLVTLGEERTNLNHWIILFIPSTRSRFRQRLT